MRIFIGFLSILLAAVALWFLSRDLVPPKSVRFAAGAAGGGYYAIAERYRARLARDDIDMEIVETSGSVENAALLGERRVDVALLQGGIAAPEGTETLGAMFYEPLFVFARRDAEVPANPGRWAELTIAAGAPGSGTTAAFDALERAAGHAPGANRRLPLSGAEAADALLRGEADLAVFVAPLSAPYLAPLFAEEGVGLLQLEHITALSRRMPQAEAITLPAAGVSFAPVVPPEDLRMLGMVANLVADERLHPSLADRLAMAARDIHGAADAITRTRQFPSAEAGALPVDAYAATLIRQGPSPLQDVLPYWVVAQVNRFAILLLPILFILLPLVRALPGVYSWRMRRRVFRYYPMIRAIDMAARKATEAETLTELERRLEAIDEDVAEMTLPPPYRDRAYTARLHIDLVRQRIDSKLQRF
ncbi:hypothetical protein Ga0609869_000842 [Rhodovulum iodosum]|uniref:C4-dicarboxylate ABC transporter substrate-binding protein n=1 Tax=Rhodovulum iodosum TaxID=68291 RepID=A0ABV3XQX2_9RHOB|nr:TAXI family TRAP transporter solute-binding subunit [Rhodovulum robiginosum]RSK39435.1 hypothetical protein EJA01_01275 [Rhodovulum robiginosum]